VALQLAGRDEPFTMVGKGAGPLPTARSVARDLGQLGRGQYSQLPELAAARCSAEWTGEWYLRCSVADQAGVFAQVALALSEQGLSIAEATQQMSQQGRAHIVLVLQKSPRTQVEAALAAISSHSWCQGLLCLPRL